MLMAEERGLSAAPVAPQVSLISPAPVSGVLPRADVSVAVDCMYSQQSLGAVGSYFQMFGNAGREHMEKYGG